MESLNLSRNYLKCFIISTFYLIILDFLYLFPDILEFWCMVTVTFKFTMLYRKNYLAKERQADSETWSVN